MVLDCCLFGPWKKVQRTKWSHGEIPLVQRVREAVKLADRVTKSHKRLADSYIGISAYVALLSVHKDDPLSR